MPAEISPEVSPPGAEPAAGRSSGSRARLALLIRIAGILLAVVAVVICVRTIAGQWAGIRHAVRTADPALIVAGLVASVVSMTGLGVLWWRCLVVFGQRRPLRQALAWYFAGELGKYLPGGIWPVVGRGELATRGGVRRSVAYLTTMIAMAVMCVGAAVVCGVLTPFLVADGGGTGWVLLLLLLVPVGVVAVHPAVFGRILAVVGRLTRGRVEVAALSWSRMLTLIAWSCPTWIFLGGASVLVTRALGYDQNPARVAFAAVAAWIIGFLCVPVPAGAGIRELAFVAVCGLDAGPATAVAAIARVLLLVTDGGGGLAGLAGLRRQFPGRPRRADGPAPGGAPPATSLTVDEPRPR